MLFVLYVEYLRKNINGILKVELQWALNLGQGRTLATTNGQYSCGHVVCNIELDQFYITT